MINQRLNVTSELHRLRSDIYYGGRCERVTTISMMIRNSRSNMEHFMIQHFYLFDDKYDMESVQSARWKSAKCLDVRSSKGT